jgi:hypothetical protein
MIVATQGWLSLSAQNILVHPYLQSATPSSIVIMWETNINGDSGIRYGTTPDLGNSATAFSISTLGSTFLHTSTLQDLTPGTRYYYKASTGNWQSEIFDFVTPPLRSSEASMNIVLMSDMQKDGGNPNIFQNLINTSLLPYISNTYGSPLSDHLQMAILPGDVVDNGNSYLQWKNDFFDPGQVLWRSVPSYPAIGNHEANSQNYFNYFTLPPNGTSGYMEHWYTHDYSNVRVLSFDSNNPYRIAAQLNWLDSVLTASCSDTLIDFVFAQMHHPHKSELWTPGEISYTGEIIERLENFSDDCGKPTIHFFGHTHAYSRGQSRDHDHLWVNVATSGGNIDYWGEFENQDYDEFIVSQDEYGFVMVEVTAGDDPTIVLKRLSFGDQYNPGGDTQTDYVEIRKNNTQPDIPFPVFPLSHDTVSSSCLTLQADMYLDSDGDEHGASHWQISSDSSDFTTPVVESWKQYANWYNEVDLQANDDLTNEDVSNLPGGQALFWRVRYRDKSLAWSEWSEPSLFYTRSTQLLSPNLVQNGDAENGVTNWTATAGVIESLGALECNGINPFAGLKYFGLGALCVDNAFGSAYQDINLSAFMAPIDSNIVFVNFGSYMADWENTDEPAMALQFLNENNILINSTDTLRHRMSAWTLKENTIPVPAGTRTIRCILMGKRFAGADNDSYIDNVFVKLVRGNPACSTYEHPGQLYGRVYVDKNAAAHADGRSWTTAFRNIPDAFRRVHADTLINEVWIANGLYPVTYSESRDSSLFLQKKMAVYGGFEGSETDVSQRNIPLHPTVLSGNIGDTLLANDNVYHVIYIDSVSDSIVIDGITITGGNANGVNDPSGGGILVGSSNTGTVRLINCRLENNLANEGSAIINNAILDLSDCTIISAEENGGSCILNAGPAAILSLLRVNIHQQCIQCPQAIQNITGAMLHVTDVQLEKN